MFWQIGICKSDREAVVVRKIDEASIVPEVPVSRPEALIVGSNGYFVSVVLDHPHSAGSPQMRGHPLHLPASQLVSSDQMPSLANMFAAFGNLLHGFCLGKVFFEVLPEFAGNAVAVVAHGSASDGAGKRLMALLFGVHLQFGEELRYLNRALLYELVEIEVALVLLHMRINIIFLVYLCNTSCL